MYLCKSEIKKVSQYYLSIPIRILCNVINVVILQLICLKYIFLGVLSNLNFIFQSVYTYDIMFKDKLDF